MDITKALEVAREAAREAAAILRAAFHRPGGPAGHGGHAEADDAAEAAIRARLLAAFPEVAYLGEETGAAGPAGARCRWLVDPNDGTKAYLAGFRGSAVSIALLRDGVPVLGVVHAPLAPDDDGDELAWAEGLPLLRNGVEVRREPLPDRLAADHVVLVSQHADRNPAANAACAAPARFRAVPSIAYRLALVAAGEAEAAVSLNGPTGWDYAAGHALLRAVGGELLHADGRPVRYDRGGGDVFGGSAGVAAELAGRDWGAVLGRAAPAKALLAPARGEAVEEAGMLARAQGTLLGQLAGDALGSMVEFMSPDRIAKAHPEGLRRIGGSPVWGTIAGQPTDDSELALALARTLVGRGFDRAAIAAAYRAWRDSGPFDIGNATRAGLAGRPIEESQANGGLMRVSPLGVFGAFASPERVAAWAREECAITHVHPVCRDASAAYAVAVAHAVRTGAGPRETWAAALAWAREAEAERAVIEALEAAEHRAPANFTSNQGWVPVALQNAFFRLLHAPTLEAGVVETVAAGGDTDTNAAIAGALLGAVHGRAAIPAGWARAVLSCRPLPGTPKPRPDAYWPVDALVLAERLLLAGAAAEVSG